MRSLAKVPELPKFKIVFFFAINVPFLYLLRDNFFSFEYFDPNFFKLLIVDLTSSDSNILSIVVVPYLPIQLIDF